MEDVSDEQLMLIAKEWSREFDSSNQALKIAKEYGRAMDIQIIQDEKLPDEDLVCGLDDQLANTAKSIIKETLYLQNQNNGVSDRELIGIIEKYLNEMTAKL